MSGPEVMDFAREAIYLLLRLCGPILGVALGVGLTVALLQALTQIQEMTLVFVPKILSIFLMLIFTLPVMGQLMGAFMEQVIARIVSG